MSIDTQNNKNNNNKIPPEEKYLLDEWIKQLEDLKKELQILQQQQEGQYGIVISEVVSKIAKIHTGIQLWKIKNIDKVSSNKA